MVFSAACPCDAGRKAAGRRASLANKTAAIKDLAAKTLDGTIPTRAALHRMSDEEIIARLTTVRGIGRWTVEMMLLFDLGRLDVWPVDDYGVRKGYAKTSGKGNCRSQKNCMPWARMAALSIGGRLVFLAGARQRRRKPIQATTSEK